MWFTICAQLFIWHICSQHFRQQAFSLAAFFIPSPCDLSFLNPPSLLHFLSLLSFILLRWPISFFFIFSLLCIIRFFVSSLHHSAPHSYVSSISTRLESLVSNHTHLEPTQLCSTTHGNHLKLLGWSPPLFLCPLFSYFSFLSISPILNPFLPLHSFYSTLYSPSSISRSNLF